MESQDFHRIKNALLDSEALSSPDFTDLKTYPFIVSLDFSGLAIAVTISQVQMCQDGQFRRRLLLVSGRKNSKHAVNYSSHKGEMSALIWALKTYDFILKLKPFLVETNYMSVKHLHNLKDMKGVFTRWYKVVSKIQLLCNSLQSSSGGLYFTRTQAIEICHGLRNLPGT